MLFKISKNVQDCDYTYISSDFLKFVSNSFGKRCAFVGITKKIETKPTGTEAQLIFMKHFSAMKQVDRCSTALS